MKTLFRFLAASTLLLSFVVGARAGDGDLWITNYSAALEKAKAEKKLVLLDFTGSDWCGWCKKLDKEVFSQKEFQDFASERFVLVTVDFPRRKAIDETTLKQNHALQDQFKIEGYPTIVIVDASGREVDRLGYEEGGPANFNKLLTASLAKAK
ncbi:thioredoxin family protein [Nibricoccus sp. IMCC34717]|uniref:thioredoxin family protein n=1 Tax=Nibricoccus sp. IMCC34717 TaxID=3034021 RepID=UPI00384CDC37